MKLGNLDENGDEQGHEYEHVWSRQETSGQDRLAIAPRAEHSKLLVELSRTLPEPFGLLYVLLVSRVGNELGRYQSSETLTRAELEEFVAENAAYLDGDGRHHLWIMSLPANATLVYDSHNVIYAYGDLEAYERVLWSAGLERGRVAIPAPHVHCYNQVFDDDEQAMFERWDWIHFPLQEADDP